MTITTDFSILVLTGSVPAAVHPSYSNNAAINNISFFIL